ncbi:hypothetical protein KJ865_04160, partial [Myxococcota bacterium]|nr:hypothetical protein [Myxococcota bacterium]
MACISAEDLAEPVCETYNGEVYSESEESYEGSLVLKVVSGERRTLSVTLFYATAQGVLSYDYYYPALTLDPGDQTLTAQLNLTPTFTLEAIISGESLLPTALVPVDILTGVTFPAVDLSVDAFGNSVITIEHLPQGRFFYLVPVGETTPYRFCPIYSGQGGVLQKTINIDDESC